ncbi:MAG: cyclase family protein [Methanoregulaceae archaeon]|jgi:arylformamidase|nr:cyclase family protein [Methanoregulaceae archaeon]
MSDYYDVTHALSEETPVYPGDFEPRFSREDCGQYLLTAIQMSTHSGTHIDAPSHYLKNEESIDRIPISALIGPCRVIEVTGAGGEIMEGHLKGRIAGATRILLKTGCNFNGRFDPDYISLGITAAKVLTGGGIIAVGIDSPSIERFHGNGDVHRELLGKGIVVIEFLDLAGVPEGDYMMVALPLRLRGLDGSPARVVLTKSGLPAINNSAGPHQNLGLGNK